jgi:regulator of cell morphogenesis and NO signaling
MTVVTPSATVGSVVVHAPQLARVFEELQIDYCCGGKRSLEDVCRERQLDLPALIERLTRAQAVSPAAPGEAWSTAPLAALCDHIERTHHDYLRQELPRLTALVAKVAHVHATNHQELATVEAVFAELRAELEPHMMNEERVLFPAIRYLESTGQAMQFPFGSLKNPIRAMVNEHDHAGDALARLRQLTADYVPPAGACNTYRVMLDGLATLERDMHQHVHKENNILFPRAVELEASLAGGSLAVHECAAT